MPHLGAKTKGRKQRHMNGDQRSSKTSEVRETAKGPAVEGDKLLSLTTTATKRAPNGNGVAPMRPQASEESHPQARLQKSPPEALVNGEAGGAPSENGRLGQKPITPSPFMGGDNRAAVDPRAFYGRDMLPGWAMGPPMIIHPHGPDVRRLFPSPIRTMQQHNTAIGPAEEGSRMPGLKMSPIVKTPGAHHFYPHQQNGTDAPPSQLKRPADDAPAEEPPSKKKLDMEEKGNDDDDDDDAKSSGDDSPVSVANADKASKKDKTSKKPVISPTNSSEAKEGHEPSEANAKTEPDKPAKEMTNGKPVPPGFSYMDRPGQGPFPPQPVYVPLGALYGQPGPYLAPPYMAGYPPLPPQAMHSMQHITHVTPLPPPHLLVHKGGLKNNIKKVAPGRKPATKPKSIAPKVAKAPKIKSTAEWQSVTRKTGAPPSAGRCIPLKEPIPTRYWGEEDAEKIIVPEFHRLVNFSEYLAKNKVSPGCAPQGKRHCVMCGKLRLCPIGPHNSGNRDMLNNDGDDDEETDTTCIIPRQNKGLCTACDVTIWVVVEQGIEIKWCKGCKNFRPWAAFGDKGHATKCIRCRDRQREKYALQKEQLRARRLNKSKTHGGFSAEEKKDDENPGETMAAAKGLRNLMSATL